MHMPLLRPNRAKVVKVLLIQRLLQCVCSKLLLQRVQSIEVRAVVQVLAAAAVYYSMCFALQACVYK
jgi:hypothetical protein